MQADLTRLRERILETARRSAVGRQVEDVALEPDRSEDGGDFLRVVVRLKPNGDTDDAGFEALLEAIEDTVGSLDDRYPSVRFSEAA
jgi:hypothetical protein